MSSLDSRSLKLVSFKNLMAHFVKYLLLFAINVGQLEITVVSWPICVDMHNKQGGVTVMKSK